MPTIADTIAIKLNLDPSGFLQGEAAALAALSRTKRTLEQQGTDLERIAKNLGYGLEKVVQGVAGFFGLVLTFQGFKNLVVDAANAGTTMGRFAESIGKTVEQTQAYKQAFSAFSGGETGILQTIRQMKLDLAAFPQVYTDWMTKVETLTGKTVRGKEPEKVLQDIADAIKRRGMTAAQVNAWLGGSLPLTDADILLLSKPGGLEKALEEQKNKVGTPTTPQAEAMEKMQADLTNLENMSNLLKLQAATLLEPFLHKLLTSTIDVLNWLRSVATMLGMTQKMTGSDTAVLVDSRGNVVTGAAPTLPSDVSALRTGRTSFDRTTGKFKTVPITRAAAPGTGTSPAAAPVSGAPPATTPGAVGAVGGGPPAAFIFHHTSGRGTVEGVQETLRQRGLGVEYVMDRDGNITQIGGPGSSHMMTGWGAGAGLSNRNTVGMEVIAKDDKDVTPAQIEAAKRFIAERYPNTPVYGHGEVNPGHKEADEGMSIVGAIRRQREGAVSGTTVRGSTFDDTKTASGRSAATTSGIAIPSGGKMGDLYEITTPDGRKFIAPLIDRGPAGWTGRGVDISGPLAKQMGYGKDFPTDARFGVRPYTLPLGESGAAAKAREFEASRPKVENNETSTHINQVEVHTHATDAAGIAEDVKNAIGKHLEAPASAPAAQ